MRKTPRKNDKRFAAALSIALLCSTVGRETASQLSPPAADPGRDFYALGPRYPHDDDDSPPFYRWPIPPPSYRYRPPDARVYYPFDPADWLGPCDFRDRPSPPHAVNFYVFPPQNPLLFQPDGRYSRRPADPRPAVKTLHLDEGDFCRRGHGSYPDYWCVNAKNCGDPLAESFRDDNVLDVCSFVGTETIVCCPKLTIVEETSTTPPAGTEPRDVDEMSSASPIGPVRPSVQDHKGPDVGPPIAGTDVNAQNSDAKPTSDDYETPPAGTNAEAPSPPAEEMATAPGPDAFLPSKEPPKPSTGEASNGGDDTLSAALDDLFSTTEVPAATTDSTDYDPAAVQKAFSETTAEVFGPKLEETEKGPDANTIADFDQSVVPSQTPAVNVVRPSIDKTLTTGPDAENNAQNSNVAIKKCRQYIAADYAKDDYNARREFMSDRDPDHSNEYKYPHMTIIGYGETAEDKNEWKCGGSLVSERWILTAAHCYKIGSLARWARLGVEYSPGVLDIRSAGNGAGAKDYRIIRHVLHPNYRKSGHHDDIALFCLDRDVEFSAQVRPICLNSDPSLNPSNPIATSWGGTSPAGERRNDVLFGDALDVIPANECKRSYSSVSDPKLRSGIRPDSMICASSSGNDGDTCSGVPGGPLQIENAENPDTYTLLGVTSFCGTRKYPGIHARVSGYIRWIEGVVWPNGSSSVRPIVE